MVSKIAFRGQFYLLSKTENILWGTNGRKWIRVYSKLSYVLDTKNVTVITYQIDCFQFNWKLNDNSQTINGVFLSKSATESRPETHQKSKEHGLQIVIVIF